MPKIKEYIFYNYKNANTGDFLKEKLNWEVRYSRSGAPYLPKSGYNISISHKNNVLYIGIAQKPFTIGVDVENINQKLHLNSFIKNTLNDSEIFLLDNLAGNRAGKKKYGVIFWSLKEAVFKCLNEDLKPKDIMIINIDSDNNCAAVLKTQKKFKSRIKFMIKGNYVYTLVLCK